MAIHGKDSYFALEDSAGATLRDISPYTNSVQYSRQNDTSDTTTFGAEGHTFITGLTNGKITLAGLWDKTATVGSATIFDALVDLDTPTLTFNYGPEGNTAGQVKYSGECILESVDYSAPVGDIVTYSAVLQITGTVTKGVF